nr:MAG TPA: hypothetical protein [Crassvirales sp.]
MPDNKKLDPIVESIMSGGIIANPSYNPKTKKGREQPQYIQQTAPSQVYDMGAAIGRSSRQIYFDNSSLGLTADEWKKEQAAGATVSPYYNQDERNKHKARAQSGAAVFGNTLVQMLGSEAAVGTVKGIFDLIDRGVNAVKSDPEDDYRDDVTGVGAILEDVQEQIREQFPIYRENPDKNWDITDGAWWGQNMTNIGSSLAFLGSSLALGKAASMVGKIGGTYNIARGINAVNVGLAKAGAAVGAVKNVYTTAKFLGNAEQITGMAFLSRTMEGHMEARETYKNVYSELSSALNNMSDAQYKDFVARNQDLPDINNLSKDEIAKRMATAAADSTFEEDYWMIASDMLQFSMLKNLWKGFSSRATTSALRSAQDGVLNRLAGITEENAVKGGILSRGIKGLWTGAKSIAKSPYTRTSIAEGFEEGFQGSVQKNSEDIALFKLDGKHKIDGLADYATSASIWEQAFWGAVGGIAFQGAGSAMGWAGRAISNRNKSESQRLLSEDKAREAEINGRVDAFNTLVRDLRDLNNGYIPGQYETDELGNARLDENGTPIRRRVKHGEAEVESAKNKLFDDFLVKFGISAAMNGNSRMFRDMLDDKRFMSFLDNNTDEKDNSKEIVDKLKNKLDDIYEKYNANYLNVFNSVKDADEHVARAAAMQMILQDNAIDDIDRRKGAIDERVKQFTDGKGVAEEVYNHVLHNLLNNKLADLNNKLEQNQNDYDNKNKSKSAYESDLAAFQESRKRVLDFAARIAPTALSESAKGFLSTAQEKRDYQAFENEIYEHLNTGATNERTALAELPANVKFELLDKAMLDIERDDIVNGRPTDKKGYAKLYNNIGETFFEIGQDKYTEAVTNVAKWLENQDNIEEAFNRLVRDEVDELQDELDLIKLGSTNATAAEQLLQKTVQEIIRRRENKARQANTTRRNGINRTNESREGHHSTGEVVEDNTLTDENDPLYVREEPVEDIVPEVVIANPNTTTANESNENATNENLVPVEERNENVIEEQPTEQESNEVVNQEAPQQTAAQAAYNDAVDDIKISTEGVVFDVDNDTEARDEAMRVAMANIRDVNGETGTTQQDYIDGTNKLEDVRKTLKEKLRQEGVPEAYIEDGVNMAVNNIVRLFARQAKRESSVSNDAVVNAITKIIDGEFDIDQYNDFVKKVINDYIKGANLHITSSGRVTIDAYKLFDYIITSGELTADEAKEVISYLYDFIKNYNIDSSDAFIEDPVNNTDPDAPKKYYTIKWVNKSALARELKNPTDVYAQIIANREIIKRTRLDKRMHIAKPNDSYLEREEAKGNRTYKKYRDVAINAAANGARVIPIKNGNSISFVVNITIEENGKTKNVDVEIGFIKGVNVSNDGNALSVEPFNNNFEVSYSKNEDGRITSSIDRIISAMLNEKAQTEEGNALFDVLIGHAAAPKFTSQYRERYEAIKNNPLYKDLLSRVKTKYGTEEQQAIAILNQLTSIVFTYDGIATGKKDLFRSYRARNKRFFANYSNTLKIQEAIAKDKSNELEVHLSGSSERHVEYGTNLVDIKEAGLNYEQNPIVIFEGINAIAENGNTYTNTAGFRPGTMGMLVDDNAGSPIMALFKESNPIASSPELYKAIGGEAVRIVEAFQNGQMEFEEVAERLENLLGNKGYNVGFSIIKGINIAITDTAITFIKNNKVTAVIHKYKPGTTSRGTGITYADGKSRTSKLAFDRTFVTNMFVDILNSAKFNPTWFTIKGTNRENSNIDGKDTHYYEVKNGYIKINIGDYQKTYNNFGHFAQEHNAFKTNHINGGSFVGNSLYISVNELSSPVEGSLHSETIRDTPNTLLTNNKQVKAVKLLEAAGFSKEHIDQILAIEDGNGNSLISDKVYLGEETKDNANAYYKGNDVYITPKGLKLIDNHRTGKHDLIRLLIHENLHRHFDRLGVFKNTADENTQRVIKDIIETFDKLREALSDPNKSRNIKDQQKNAILRLMAQIETAYRRQGDIFDAAANARFAEEWITESLSQKNLAAVLNNIDYEGDGISDVTGIEEENKSFFQKIIDLLMKLFRIGGGKVKNNSIFARQYYILSQIDGNVSKEDIENNEENNNITENENQQTNEETEETVPDVEHQEVESNDAVEEAAEVKEEETQSVPVDESVETEDENDEETSVEDSIDSVEEEPADDFNPEDYNTVDESLDELDELDDEFDAITDYIDGTTIGNNRAAYVSNIDSIGRDFTATQKAFVAALEARGELVYRCGL